MATVNPFDILGNNENDDPIQIIAAAGLDKPKKALAPVAAAPAQKVKPAANLPSKPLPPSQAVREVREAKNESGRGGRGRGGGRGFGQGRGGGRRYEQDSGNTEGSFGGSDGFLGGYGRRLENGESGKPLERRGSGGARGPFRGGRQGGSSNGEAGEGERPRRFFDRHSGTGRGNEVRREGSGRGNWGTPTDDIAQETEGAIVDAEKTVGSEKKLSEEEAADAGKENATKEAEEEHEPEDKEMTLEEYEKVLEEKRKALLAMKSEERKVEVDKELKSMQQLSSKKGNDEIFIKLGSEKDKRKDAYEKEEKSKKSVSINEFLKPAEGERYYSPGGRGRGRGRGPRGGGGSFDVGYRSNDTAPKIEDPGHFPTLGGK
ncbi:hypothetical protein SAY87_012840 [Trapa incisa]|uniref:Hyaluronan/mRNA-binding protein domain-containing protein n=2 Tax=Trapa TaxID=22665 RepID=A0AAN7R8R1_TRANT|nr:hypothetical protein SAY87_012840 [Trapa incisa]KAK4796234.1 hypothetical protein SAY86_028560 [Trapa natans]